MAGFSPRKLKAIRLAKGWTLKDMEYAYRDAALALDIDRTKTDQTFRNWEKGKGQPEYDDTVVICHATGCTPEDLARMKGEPPEIP